MKTFLALLVAVIAIGLHAARTMPEARAALSKVVPNLDTLLPQAGSGNGLLPTLRPSVDKEKLVGAWIAEDNCELLFLRADGKARKALAGQFEAKDKESAFRSANLSGVVMADWSLEGNRLKMEMGEDIQKFEMRKQRLDVESQPGYRNQPEHASRLRNRIYAELPEVMRKDFINWAKVLRGSGNIAALTDDTLTIEYQEDTVTYRRINPAQAKDPDSANAAVVDSYVSMGGTLTFTCGVR